MKNLQYVYIRVAQICMKVPPTLAILRFGDRESCGMFACVKYVEFTLKNTKDFPTIFGKILGTFNHSRTANVHRKSQIWAFCATLI